LNKCTVKELLFLHKKAYVFDMERRGFTFEKEKENPSVIRDRLRKAFPEYSGWEKNA